MSSRAQDSLSILYLCLSRFMANPVELAEDDVESCKALARKEVRDSDDTVSKEASQVLSSIEAIAEALTGSREGLESHYIALFELSPTCPPYIGYYAFSDERDRRLFMVEVAEMYKVFGFKLAGRELPDYIPAICEFLGLTVGSKSEHRVRFIVNYLKPYINSLLECLRRSSPLYFNLYNAFAKLIDIDLSIHGVVRGA